VQATVTFQKTLTSRGNKLRAA